MNFLYIFGKSEPNSETDLVLKILRNWSRLTAFLLEIHRTGKLRWNWTKSTKRPWSVDVHFDNDMIYWFNLIFEKLRSVKELNLDFKHWKTVDINRLTHWRYKWQVTCQPDFVIETRQMEKWSELLFFVHCLCLFCRIFWPSLYWVFKVGFT